MDDIIKLVGKVAGAILGMWLVFGSFGWIGMPDHLMEACVGLILLDLQTLGD